FSPDKVLVNVPDRFNAIVLGKEKMGEKELIILKLTPKENKGNLQWMKLWVDDDEHLMKKIQALDISDNLTTYAIEKVSLKQGLNDKQFHYEALPGIEVIDLR